MYMDEVNETGHRRRQQPEPPGSDGFGGATRVREGWSVKPKRADQFVLGDVGYDNHRRRKLRTIRELARSQASKEGHFSRDRSSFSIHGNDFPPSDGLVCFFSTFVRCYGRDLLWISTGLRFPVQWFCGLPGVYHIIRRVAVSRLESRTGLDNFPW